MHRARMDWTRGLVLTVILAVSAPAAAHAASDTLKAALICRKTITAQGRAYADKRLRFVLVCAERLLKCELGLEAGGTDPKSCRSRAGDSCKRTIGTAPDSGLNRAASAFITKSAARCLGFGISGMLSNAAGGLWFSNDPACGASGDIPTLLGCVRSELEAEADALIGRTLPRAGLLLDNAGFGGSFPNLPRPPTVDVLLSAVALNGGDLINPGTIQINAGEAIRFSGDTATLPCGGGQNGRVTIFISTAADPCSDMTAQQGGLREPYGPTRTVTMGPYTVDQNYCITLHDGGGCQDTESGVVQVQ